MRRVPGPDDFPEDGVGGWRLLPSGTDWMDDAEWEAYQTSLADEEEPADPELYSDPDKAPPPGLDDAQLAEPMAGAREINRAGFASGGLLDRAPGCTALMGFADDVAGADDRYPGASNDELIGAIRAWDRVEAHAAARKHAAVAELIRRFPEPGCAPEGEAQMPMRDEFLPDELASALAESRFGAENLLDLAHDLEVKLPGTMTAFRSGMLRQRKAEIIARATDVLDPDEARAAESLVLGRAAKLTPGGLRAAIARAVMEVAPDKARKRREEAVRDTRVERWAEDSGNAALAGRELPPAAVLAADQKITWWAKELKKAGLAGDMDELRARAFLDILLDVDSRPERPGPDTATGTKSGRKGQAKGQAEAQAKGQAEAQAKGQAEAQAKGQAEGERTDGESSNCMGSGMDGSGTAPAAAWPGAGQDGPAGVGSGPEGPGGSVTPGPSRTRTGAIPPGFVGRVNLTIPLTTLLDLADRPGEIGGLGPIDPALARDLASAAARNPKTTWCVTVTDQHGHAIGHGCARPGPKQSRAGPKQSRAERGKPGPPGGHDLPRGIGHTDGPGFTFTAEGQPGPVGGYGNWRLSAGASGQPELMVALEPIAIDECDHRHEAQGHDPGVKLRHLSQVRHATCTGPTCRRPAERCDFEHNVPYEVGGRTCMCNGGPKCRHDHRLKQDSRWKVEQPAPGVIQWTTPAGREYTTEPTRYPI